MCTFFTVITEATVNARVRKHYIILYHESSMNNFLEMSYYRLLCLVLSDVIDERENLKHFLLV